MTLVLYQGPRESASFIADQQTFVAPRGVAIDVPADAVASMPAGWVLASGAVDGTQPLALTGATDLTRAALRLDSSANTHIVIINRTGGAPVNGNALLVTGNDHSDIGPMDTTFGISGYETGKGTIKATHNRPAAGGVINDQNASALSLRCNGVGTAAQGIFLDAEDGGTTGNLLNLRNNLVQRFAVNFDGDIVTGGRNTNSFEAFRSAALVYTMDELVAQGQSTLVSGTMYGAAAIAAKAGTYGNLRFVTGGTVPATLTDVRLCVWDSSGNLLGSTANISASVTTANTLFAAALSVAVTLTQAQVVYLGIAWVGTTLNIRGASVVSALTATRTGRTLVTARAASGYTGGTPIALTSGSTGIVPWVELF